MNENDNFFFNLDVPLILDNEVNSSLNISDEILNINQLIKTKYLTNKNVWLKINKILF